MSSCLRCGKDAKLHPNGMCNACTVMCRYIAREPVDCSRCGRMLRPFVVKKRLCKSCYQVMWCEPGASLKGSEEYSRKLKEASNKYDHRREKSGRWRGGRFIDPTGYVRILAPDDYMGKRTHGGRYIAEHRYIAETQILGRLLLPNEVVHHMNHIKTDNRPDNLKVFSSVSEHRVWHVTHPAPILL